MTEDFRIDPDAPHCGFCFTPSAQHGAYPPYPAQHGQECPGYVWPQTVA